MIRAAGDRPSAGRPLSNEEIADLLEEVATLLQRQEANVYRITAYRRAAEELRALDRPAERILFAEGTKGLRRIPGVGVSLARSIEQLLRTGRLPLLERLRGEETPERLLASVPGIGPEMAHRIHQRLGIDTLPELELAAWDGRLDEVPGMGPRRVRAVRESLAGRFRREIGSEALRRVSEEPPVAELLDVDAEYRRKAEAGQLHRIAPRRFNPSGELWLPVLHTRRDDRHYTALYSNTRRAHELGAVFDWVVIYRDDQGGTGQWTVVTAQSGPEAGRRVVRGREAECRAYYGQQSAT